MNWLEQAGNEKRRSAYSAASRTCSMPNCVVNEYAIELWCWGNISVDHLTLPTRPK